MKTFEPIKKSDNLNTSTAKTITMRCISIVTGICFLFMPFFIFSQNMVEGREVEPFSTIQAGGMFNLYLLQGDEFIVEIETPQDFKETVETTVTNGTLTLSMQRTGGSARITARIFTPALEGIRLSGAASLKTSGEFYSPKINLVLSGASRLVMNLHADSIVTRGSGASNITLAGIAQFHNIVMSGASQLKAEELITDTTLIHISGAANANVSASQMADINGSGTSRVTYSPEPRDIRINLSGTATANEHIAQITPGAEQNLDTVKVRVGRRDLWILEEDVNIEKAPEKSFKGSWAGFELGVNGYLTPENSIDIGVQNAHLELHYAKSVAVNLNLLQQSLVIIDKRLGLVTGLGLGFNNYRFEHQYRFIPHRDGLIPVLETEREITKSKITLTHLNVPLLIEFQTHGNSWYEKLRIAGGLIAGTRIGTHAKYVFANNGRRDKEKTRDSFNIQPFRFDVTGRIGLGKFNVFATYSLNPLFKENRGPELYPFSVGLQIIRF